MLATMPPFLMENPFPGMNPWLEAHWQSVHSRLLTYLGDQLGGQLPGGLAALTEERVVVESLRDDFPRRALVPDISVSEPWDGGALGGGGASASRAALAEAKVIMLDDVVEKSLHIVDGAGDLITAIEVISPANKDGGRGEEAYYRKQRTYQEGGINLIEIDLLRKDGRIFVAPPINYGDREDYPYGVSIWRAAVPDRAFSYPVALRERLPVIPIPLRREDEDIVLDLQPAIDLVYRNGRYGNLIRYEYQPVPPLSPKDRAWANERLGIPAEE